MKSEPPNMQDIQVWIPNYQVGAVGEYRPKAYGLKNFVRADMNLPPRTEGASTSREAQAQGHAPPKKLKNRVFLMPESKILEILGILMKQNLNRKNARLLNKNCPD